MRRCAGRRTQAAAPRPMETAAGGIRGDGAGERDASDRHRTGATPIGDDNESQLLSVAAERPEDAVDPVAGKPWMAVTPHSMRRSHRLSAAVLPVDHSQCRPRCSPSRNEHGPVRMDTLRILMRTDDGKQ
jgi:hypothetical protein